MTEALLSQTDRSRTVAAISNVVVRIHARAYGKGPTRASTHLRDGQYVLCLLRDPFTRGEKTLIASGRTDAVHLHRSAFHEAVEDSLRTAVENLTGWPVDGYVPGVSIESDLVTQLFLLKQANYKERP